MRQLLLMTAGGIRTVFSLFLMLGLGCTADKASASQTKIGLDLEWRPIEGLDEKPAAPTKTEGSPREQRKSEAEPRPSGNAGEVKTFTVKGVSFTMIRVPAGEFMMGSPSSESGRDDDETQHRVRISKDYWIGETEVTQGLWKAVMGSNPSRFYSCGDDCPVEQVSWNDCQEFIRKLNGMVSGGSFRLPTEAEWEYAARSGGKDELYSGGNDLDALGWYKNNSGSRTHPAKQKRANDLGIYDISGNVWEWCEDWYGDYPSGSVTDAKGPSSGSNRVLRGGGWYDPAWRCRSASRNGFGPDLRISSDGFRLARP